MARNLLACNHVGVPCILSCMHVAETHCDERRRSIHVFESLALEDFGSLGYSMCADIKIARQNKESDHGSSRHFVVGGGGNKASFKIASLE